MARVFLIGDPVAHSLSPAMQNAAFEALGLPHTYELLRVPAAEVAAAVAGLREDDALGANVTIPHKEIVAEHLDGVEETARRIGAVNTIFKRGGALWGDNTDAGGFTDALTERGVNVEDRRVLVLGAGGAARSCVYQLARAGASTVIAGRTWDRARDLAASILPALPKGTLAGHDLGVRRWPVRDLNGLDVVVNATSLGLHGEDPLEGVVLPRSTAIVDVVATAQETPLVKRARGAGCVVVDGLLMLLHQGTRAFRLWTGVEAPVDVMRAALPRKV